jgi:hypothetical protein
MILPLVMHDAQLVGGGDLLLVCNEVVLITLANDKQQHVSIFSSSFPSHLHRSSFTYRG